MFIRLLHDTTREYLETHIFRFIPRGEPTTLEDPTTFNAQKNDIAMANAHKTIATICVTYLSFSAFESGCCQTDDEFEERLRSNLLYDYAAQNWGHHARKASNLSQVLSQAVVDFLESETKVEASSQGLLAIKRSSSHSNYSQDFPRQITGLHLTAFFGVKEAINAHHKKGVEADLKDTDGRTPLSWAAEKGHQVVVKLLLATGKVDVESKDSEYSLTPLFRAAQNRHEAVVQLLLENGAAVDARDQAGWIPLLLAVRDRYEVIVCLLLDKGAAMDVKYQSHGVLHLAIGSGKVDAHKPKMTNIANIVHLLSTHTADVNTPDKLGLCPIHYCAQTVNSEAAKCLLEHGARINEADLKVLN
jgi:ankyrin repeat protein